MGDIAEGFFLCAFIVLIAVAEFRSGMIVESISWKNDCEKVGAHILKDKVYDCKERK